MSDKLIEIDCSVNKTISYSMQQNHIQAIRRVRIRNNTDHAFEELDLRIGFSPEFALPVSCRISLLEAGERLELNDLVIPLNAEYLMSLTEKENGSIRIFLYQKDECIEQFCAELDILPYDQWSGMVYMPELLCSFVLPNHPVIRNMLPASCKYLAKWGKAPSIVGYETQNSNDVKWQIAAAYEAIREENICYALPPVSYESVGQKIRTPDEVFQSKIATCLDLSLFYASLLEAMGLNPILLLVKEHAYIGCWLQDKTFPECVTEDVSAIRKRTAEGIDEIIIVECTAATVGKNIDFEQAVKAAREEILKENDFRMALDVKRCRGSNILPLPSRVLENGTYKVVKVEGEKLSQSAPKELSTVGKGADVTENVLTKKQLWERKLLDLSLRNSLLNFRVNKNALQLMVPDLAGLEDELNQKQEFSILPLPGEANVKPGEDKIYDDEECRKLIETTAVSEFRNKRIRTFIKDTDLEATLKFLQRQSKHSLEENGSNTLYLAIGFLKWFETDKSQKERYAPLILVPVDLVKKIQDRTYHLRLREEESQVNITLLEFLRQDFGMDIGGLDPLPMDEHGVDIPLVLNIFRQSIMEKKRWDILPYSFLGIFSFSRFIMWNDIRNRSDDILSNKVVSSLISGKMEWDPLEVSDELTKLDESISPKDMAVVMSADSSQMKAIEMAAKGESFVLHGPPGTGKSQTITNMIANALYQGKSVLFVAEKMAALSVVQKRLERVGLDPFCLELHSNKAQKSAVLSQLEKTLEYGKQKSTEDFSKTADKINELRTRLNKAVTALHEKTPCGFSVYEFIEKYEKNQEKEGVIDFSSDYVNAFTKEHYEEVTAAIASFGVLAKEMGDLFVHPLSDFRFHDYSMEIRKEWMDLLGSYKEKLNNLQQSYDEILNLFSLQTESSFKELSYLETILGLSLEAGVVSPVLLKEKAAVIKEEEIRKEIVRLKHFVTMAKEMKEHFKPDVFSYDVKSARSRLIEAQGKWIIPKKQMISSLIKEMKYLALKPEIVNEQNLTKLYDRIELYHKSKEEANFSDFFQQAFEGMLSGADTDLEALEQFYQVELSLTKAFYCENLESDKMDRMIYLAVNGEFMPILEKSKDTVEDFMKAASECLLIEKKLMEEYGLCFSRFERSEYFIGEMKDAIEEYLAHSEDMRSYSSFCMAEKTINQYGLSELSDLFRKGELRAEDALAVFEGNFAKAAAVFYISQSQVLSHFSGSSFMADVERFREITDQFEMLTRQEVAMKLAGNLPDMKSGVAESSELGILKKAIKSNGRNMPIRKLFNQIPNLLRRMCPCMLMSPISVAQYIDPSFPKFDLVIFDEASQLPTKEAVGTMARGENVIVVGDPKQLPPTSFFMVNQQNEEEFLDIEDMESLLDDCLAISMPQLHLLWHYRSRHESLIAYSNVTYYDNRLYTFPSPSNQVSAVEFIPVEGFYDRGKTKQNRAEAEAVIAEIKRRLEDETLCKDSIGVVTFSSVQQELIEDLLSEMLSLNPKLEEYCATLEEPIFVKNLENVQGDERDIILFSIGYGPDRNGYVGMNFGPLNQEGGFRRLNVAISRARKAMMIFSTLSPHEIDLSRTTSKGVADLKGFLEYASSGNSALYAIKQKENCRTYEVAKSIAAKLKDNGYESVIGIGSSQYKMEIAVVDPNHPKQFCLGIILDGENILTTPTARDRFILQPSVLSGLGWKLLNVYTLDWFDTPQREMTRILDAVSKAVKGESLLEDTKESDINDPDSENYLTEEVSLIDSDSVKSMEEAISENSETQTSKGEDELNRIKYVGVALPLLGNTTDFYQEKTKKQIAKAMMKVIDAEQPVSRDYLYKKVVSCWGMEKVSEKVGEVLDEVSDSLMVERTQGGSQTFFWKEGMNPELYDKYRVPEEEAANRLLSDIAPQEIVNAVIPIVENNISLSYEDLIKEVSRLFGCRRRTASGDRMVKIAISCAEQRGKIQISEDGSRVNIK